MVLVRTNVFEERITSIIRVTRISMLGTSAVIFLCSMLRLLVTANAFSWLADSYHPNDGGDTFLGNVGSYMSHMV
jgi:hypothetical protein